jgi:hypothetical protein
VEPLSGDLDDAARLALEVALGSAAALGDRECGTGYVLFGIFATAEGDVSQVGELFVLDPLRIERAIQKVRDGCFSGAEYDGDPPLSARALAATRTRRHDGTGPTGVFEMLVGVLADDDADACRVLRELGVRPDDLRRLAAYGARHLSGDEAAVLLEMLDRRRNELHRPWWGPAPGASTVTVDVAEGGHLQLARSRSAIATLHDLTVSDEGVGVSLRVESLEPWVLPPVFEPPEILVPGRAPRHRVGPEMLRLSFVFADGTSATNLDPADRWRSGRPKAPVLAMVSSHAEITKITDRRTPERSVVTTTWWLWPLPAAGTVEVRVEWPAEMLWGLASFDGRRILDAAEALRPSTC